VVFMLLSDKPLDPAKSVADK